MYESIVAAIVAAIIIGIGARVVRTIFVIRPKLLISYKQGNCYSSGRPSDMIELQWDFTLECYNQSKYDAMDLEITLPNTEPQLAFPPLKNRHVRSLETERIMSKVKKLFPREVLKTSQDRFGELLPDELKTMQLIFRYRNENGRVFYTLYKKRGDSETSSYHIKKPRFEST